MIVMASVWIGFFAINPLFNKKTYKYYLIIITLVYSILAYNVVFTETMDIARVAESMKYWYRNDFMWFINNKMDMDPLSSLYYYVIGLTGDVHLIPAISILIIYGYSFALIDRVSKHFELNKMEMNICTFVFLSNFVFFYAMSNIRIYMCYAVISYYIYMELVEDKCHKIAIIFYIMAALFHYACIPFILIRVILIKYKKITVPRLVLMLVLSIVLTQFENILAIINPSSGILHTIYYKLTRYSRYDTFGIEYFVNSIIKVSGTILTYFTLKKSFGKFNVNDKRYIHYMSLSCIAFCLMITNYQIVLRVPNLMISFWVVLMSMMFFYKRLSLKKEKCRYDVIVNNVKVIIIYMCIVSILNILFDCKYIIMRNMFFDF